VKRGFAGKLPVVLLVLFGLLAAGGAGSAYALRYDQANAGRILPGVSIDGVDVSNMTRAQAIAAVTAKVDGRLDRRIHVEAGRRSLDATARDLGLSADVASVVDRALAVNDSFSWMSRIYHRLAHQPVTRSFDVQFDYTGKPVIELVDRLSKEIARSPRDASYSLVDGSVVMTPAHPGRALKYWASRDLLKQAVLGRTPSVTLQLEEVQPKVGDDSVGQLIVVNRTTNVLQLYSNFEIERTYRVATAMPGFETPPGTWTIINKVENPTWHNPAPDGWGKDEPLVIPPGPGNPLGTRALYLDASGIRIHGTPSDSSIGTWASHGCIRMHIPESEELYPLVPIGTPVFIIGSPPWGDVSDAGTAG